MKRAVAAAAVACAVVLALDAAARPDRGANGSIVFLCGPDVANLCRVTLPTHKVERLTGDGASPGSPYATPSVSADGRRLGFWFHRNAYLADAGAKHRRRLPAGGGVSLRPDGAQVLVLHHVVKSETCVPWTCKEALTGVIVDVGEPMIARQRPMFVDAADWLTRTTLVAVPDQDPGSLLRLPVRGCCGRVVFRTRLWTLADVAASPDGTQVAVTLETGTDDVSYLGVFSLRTKRLRQLTFGRHAHHTAPAWSPDGRFIVFVDRPNDESRAGALAVVPAGGGARMDLGASGSRPTWGR